MGHIQQGGAPSPTDRIRATRLAVRCVKFLEQYTSHPSSSEKVVFPSIYTNTKDSAAVIGIDGAQVIFTVRPNDISVLCIFLKNYIVCLFTDYFYY